MRIAAKLLAETWLGSYARFELLEAAVRFALQPTRIDDHHHSPVHVDQAFALEPLEYRRDHLSRGAGGRRQLGLSAGDK